MCYEIVEPCHHSRAEMEPSISINMLAIASVAPAFILVRDKPFDFTQDGGALVDNVF